jgi:hypothetical protein
MPEAARQSEAEDSVNHPVRWMGTAWERIAQAADILTAREHRKIIPADVIRIGTLRYVEEVLSEEPTAKAG